MLANPLVLLLITTVALPLAFNAFKMGANWVENRGKQTVEASAFFKAHPGFANATDWALHTMNLAVQSVGQTLVADAKSEGAFTPALAQKAKADAIAVFRSFATPQALAQLGVELGHGTAPGSTSPQMDAALGHLVEMTVAQAKTSPEAAAQALG